MNEERVKNANSPRWFFDGRDEKIQFIAKIIFKKQYTEILSTKYEFFKFLIPCFYEEHEDYNIPLKISCNDFEKIYLKLENIKSCLQNSNTILEVKRNFVQYEYNDNEIIFIFENRPHFIVMIQQLQQWLGLYLSDNSDFDNIGVLSRKSMLETLELFIKV